MEPTDDDPGDGYVPGVDDPHSRAARHWRARGQPTDSSIRQLFLMGWPKDVAREVVDRFGGFYEAADYAAQSDIPAEDSREYRDGNHGNDLLDIEGVGPRRAKKLKRFSPLSGHHRTKYPGLSQASKNLTEGGYELDTEQGGEVDIEPTDDTGLMEMPKLERAGWAWTTDIDPADPGLPTDTTHGVTKGGAMDFASSFLKWLVDGFDPRDLPREVGPFVLISPDPEQDIDPTMPPGDKPTIEYGHPEGYSYGVSYSHNRRKKSSDDKGAGWFISRPANEGARSGGYNDYDPEDLRDALDTITDEMADWEHASDGTGKATSERIVEAVDEANHEANQGANQHSTQSTATAATDGGRDTNTEMQEIDCPNCGAYQDIDEEAARLGGVIECVMCGEDIDLDEQLDEQEDEQEDDQGDDGDTYDPAKEWTDDRGQAEGGLSNFGVDPDEGGSTTEEFARAQNDGYLLTSEAGNVENEREGLGQFGARPSSTKGLEEFEEGGEPYDPTEETELAGDAEARGVEETPEGMAAMQDAIMGGGDTYDATKEWNPEEAAEQAKQMEQARKRPIEDADEGKVFDGVDRREIPDSGLSLSDITDWPYINREEAPSDDEREQFEEKMRNIYDPTDESDETTVAVDPETGETDAFDQPDGVNGWQTQQDPPAVRGLAVWTNPNAEADDYLAVTKTGPEAYLVQRKTGERGDYDLENIISEPTMGDALDAAVDYMATHSVDDQGDDGDDADEWAEAVEYLREHYGDDYGDRIDAAGDIRRHASEAGIDLPQELGGEAVLQPLLRYQGVDPESAYNQIERRHDEQVAEQVQAALVSFANAGAAGETTDTLTVTVDGTEYEVPQEGNGWQWSQPSDDPMEGVGNGPTVHARWTRGDDVLAIRGRGTNHRLFYWPGGDTNSRKSVGIGAVTFGEELGRAENYIVEGETLLATEADEEGGQQAEADAGATGDVYDPTEDLEADSDESEANLDIPDEVGPFERHETPPGRLKWETVEGEQITVTAESYGSGEWAMKMQRPGLSTGGPAELADELTKEQAVSEAVEWMESYGDGRDDGESDDGDEWPGESQTPDYDGDLRQTLVDMGVGGQPARTLAGLLDDWDDLAEKRVGELSEINGVGPATMEVLAPNTNPETMKFTVEEARKKEGLDDQGDDDTDDQPANDDQPPTERVEAFADQTDVPADVAERIFSEFGTAVGKDWKHTEERIYQAADYGDERERLLSVKGVGESRQKQIAAADKADDDDGTDLETTVAEIENAPPGGWTEEDRVDDDDGEYFVRADEGAHAYISGPYESEEAAEEHRDTLGDPGEYWVVEGEPEHTDEDQGDDDQGDRPDWPESIGGWERVDASDYRAHYQHDAPSTTDKPLNSHPLDTYVARLRRDSSDEFHAAIGNATGFSGSATDDPTDLNLGHVTDEGTTLSQAVDALAEEVEDAEAREMNGEEVEFGSLDAANEWRDDNPDVLGPRDTRASKTVVLHGAAFPSVVDDASKQAEISRGDEGKTYGTAKLTDDERDRIEGAYGLTWNDYGMEAMRAKAALVEEGATDWLNYYEPGEAIEGSLANLEAGKEAQADGQGGTGLRGDRVDADPDPGEIGERLDEAQGESCGRARDGCEDGYEDACEQLLEDCGWTQDEIDDLLATAEDLGEDPNEVYNPAAETDSGQSFEEWAAENAPADADPNVPEKPDPITEPSGEELAKLAPTVDDEPAQAEAELTGPALRSLKKAWSGYKLARTEAKDAHKRAEKYAEVINGVRAVNGQEPLDFDALDWPGGEVLPDDPGDTFPAPEGGTETMEEAQEHGHAAGVVQTTLGKIKEAAESGTYDPTGEFVNE